MRLVSGLIVRCPSQDLTAPAHVPQDTGGCLRAAPAVVHRGRGYLSPQIGRYSVMQLRDGHLWLSPSDLSAHLACPYLTRLELEVGAQGAQPPHGRDKLADLVARKGEEHEEAFLAQLRDEGRDVVEIAFDDGGFAAPPRPPRTRCAPAPTSSTRRRSSRDGWRGRADFLIRVDEPSELGAWSYEGWDTKLARSAKPAAVLQLDFYSQEVAGIQGRLPERLHVVLGTMIVETLPPGRLRRLPRTAQRRLRTHLAAPPDDLPVAVRALLALRLHPVCRERWERRRPPDARRLDPARPVEKLNGVGVQTLAGLAESPPTLHVPGSRPPMFERAARPGGLQLHRRRTGELTRRLLEPENERGFGLLPPPSPGDLFFDMEGDPFFEAARRARVPVRRALRDGRRRDRRHRASGRTTATASGRRSSSSSTSSTSGSRATPTCTSTTTPPTSRRPSRG